MARKPFHSEKYGTLGILSVDDDAVNLMVIEQLLASEGWVITSAQDGTDALEALEADTWPDVIFLDYQMNQGDAGDVVRSDRPPLPFKFVRPLTSFLPPADLPQDARGVWAGSCAHCHVHCYDRGLGCAGGLHEGGGQRLPAQALRAPEDDREDQEILRREGEYLSRWGGMGGTHAPAHHPLTPTLTPVHADGKARACSQASCPSTHRSSTSTSPTSTNGSSGYSTSRRCCHLHDTHRPRILWTGAVLQLGVSHLLTAAAGSAHPSRVPSHTQSRTQSHTCMHRACMHFGGTTHIGSGLGVLVPERVYLDTRVFECSHAQTGTHTHSHTHTHTHTSQTHI